jgi:outer membrane protein assembly factor BamD (BamD/ComL family)
VSVSGISLSVTPSPSLQNWQAKAQQVRTEFQQLGQDIQSGNISKAQSDFSTLSQNVPGSVQSNSPLSQTFSALGSALQSGNVSTAQQDYATLQQAIQQSGQDHQLHHHHSHAADSSPSNSSNTENTLSQLFSSIGSDLQSGNLSAAQTAYSPLSQDLATLGWGAGSGSGSAAGTVSLLG